jgi:radical SAM protein with 4Fe4S-binding SPASM domain
MIKIYQLEVTSHCNLHCSFCAREKQWAHKEHGFMDMALLERIDWYDTKYVELQMSGEPTLHPKISQIIQHIKSKKILVGASSNGTKKNFDYSQFDIVTTTRDIERTQGIDPSKNPNAFLQTLGENFPYEDTTHDKIYDLPEVRGCTTPEGYVSIHWDGDVVPCCKCFGKQHVFGNLFDVTMEQIVNGRARRQFLEKMPSGKNYICRFCQTPNPHQIHEKLVKWKEDQAK